MKNKKIRILVCSIILLVSIILCNSTQVFATSSSAVSLGGSSLSSAEISAFNAKFDAYAGERSGTEVKALISLITTNNTNTPAHQIKTGISTSQIDATAKYQVSLKKDTQGYINEVIITKSTNGTQSSSLSSSTPASSVLGNKNTTNSSLKDKNTITKDNTLPKTGATNIISILLVFGIVLAIVLKIKTNKYKDIK